MKFPRNIRLLRSPFDVAPFAAVFFLLLIFVMLGGLVVYTPGVRIEPPAADGLPGTDQPAVAVAVDAGGRYYFANQIVSEAQLTNDLRAAAVKSRAPLTLVIYADKAVTYDQLIQLTTPRPRGGDPQRIGRHAAAGHQHSRQTMSELRADSPALGLTGPKPARAGWPLSRWLMLIALVCAAHVGLLYMFGARKQIVPRHVTDAPTLKLAGGSDELLALNDPTLFALPHPGDFVAAAADPAPVVEPPTFRWTESPRWLPLSADELMTRLQPIHANQLFPRATLRIQTPAQSSAHRHSPSSRR